MNVVFLSNYFNHHQKPISEELYKLLGNDYCFIETTSISEWRKQLGWGIDQMPSYVILNDEFNKNKEKYERIICDADVLITGAAPTGLLQKRIQEGKLIIKYSERFLRKGIELHKYPLRWFRLHKNNPKKKPIFMLCSGAYVSRDYARFGLFKGKCYKWGYFPKTEHYEDVEKVILEKKKNSIVWVSRFIKLKHPEYPIKLAKKLKKEGYSFEINMIGNGELLEKYQKKVKKEGLSDCVHLLGAMTPEEVRTHMKKSEIFIFTSDKREGWGAVLNEAMNSACVPVSNVRIGATPYLVKHGENGFNYSGINEFYKRVIFLLNNSKQRSLMAKEAYKTILSEWNAENAAKQLLKLVDAITTGKDLEINRGPCSKA